MSEVPEALITRQVRRVRRRLWLRNLCKGVFLGWTIAFLAAAAYFVTRTLIWGPCSDLESWLTFGSAIGLGIVGGLIAAILRSPDMAESALALDDKFLLKERVTTFMTLPPDRAATPAGQALLEDVHDKVARLDVLKQFPLRLRGSQVMLPICTAALAVVALLFTPQLKFSNVRASAQAKLAANTKDAQLQLDALKKNHFEDKTKDKNLSKGTKDIEDELQKLLDKQLDPKDENKVREHIQEMRTIEDKLKERMQEMKNLEHKNKDIEKVLEQLDKLDKLGKKMDKDGPAKDFQDALAKGNLKKALDELDKLEKKLKNDGLSKDDKEKLAQQLKDLKDRLDRLSDHKDEQEQLQKDFQDGKITEDQLHREQERLKEESQDLADLQDLGDLLEDLRKGLGGMGGGGKGFQGKLERLKGKFDIDEDEFQRLLAEQEGLEQARLLLLGGCECDREGNLPGGMGKKMSKNPGGKRPVGEDPKDSKIIDQRQHAATDRKGQMRITGFTKGGSFSKIPAKEVGGAFQQADQQSSEVIDRQRIPADAADVARGYFEKLGGQK